MQRHMMKSKIHRATVTGASVDYIGSISIDPELMQQADILEGEQVHVVDINNGSRLTTYAIPGRPGEICLNGAAAHLVDIGDLVIIMTYATVHASELDDFTNTVVHVDTKNNPVDEATAKALSGDRKYVTVPAEMN